MDTMTVSPVTLIDRDTFLSRLGDAVDCYWCPEHTCENFGMRCRKHFKRAFESLMRRKFDECGNQFIADIEENGIVNPVCVQIDLDDEWVHGNGHHRTAVFYFNGMPYIPVVFSFTSDYMVHEYTERQNRPNSYS